VLANVYTDYCGCDDLSQQMAIGGGMDHMSQMQPPINQTSIQQYQQELYNPAMGMAPAGVRGGSGMMHHPAMSPQVEMSHQTYMGMSPQVEMTNGGLSMGGQQFSNGGNKMPTWLTDGMAGGMADGMGGGGVAHMQPQYVGDMMGAVGGQQQVADVYTGMYNTAPVGGQYQY
jgi:hypothetical protein